MKERPDYGRLGKQKRQRRQHNQRTRTQTTTVTPPAVPIHRDSHSNNRNSQSTSRNQMCKPRKVALARHGWWIGYYRRSWLEGVGSHEVLRSACQREFKDERAVYRYMWYYAKLWENNQDLPKETEWVRKHLAWRNSRVSTISKCLGVQKLTQWCRIQQIY